MTSCIRLIGVVGGILALVSCQTTQTYTPTNRSAEVREIYQEQSAADLQSKAEDLFSSAVQYYKSGHFQKALEDFVESQRLFERIEHLRPRVSGRLNSIKAYLSRLTEAHGHTVLRFAERQLERSRQYLSIEMLNGAEALLERFKEWNPELKDEANALIRRIRKAREEIRSSRQNLT